MTDAVGTALILALVAGVGIAGWHAYSTRRIKLVRRAEAQLTLFGEAFRSFPPNSYIAHSEYEEWRSRYPGVNEVSSDPRLAGLLPQVDQQRYLAWLDFVKGGPASIESHNKRFIEATLAADTKAFDRVESYPLTERQRRAIVTNDNANLIIAGAGTGKTSTIVGKVDFLIRHQLARPEEILLLAYNSSAAKELAERIGRLLGHSNVSATTFHALGLRIVAEASGSKPTLSKLAEDPRMRSRFIRDHLRKLMESPAAARQITGLFSRYLDEVVAPEQDGSKDHGGQDPKTLDKALREERSKGLRSLQGITHKSRQEVQIANWLTLNGIKWVYEHQYEHSTSDARRRQYLPDFYLPDSKVYIEHFGLNRAGTPAPWVSAESYKAGVEWKLKLHKEQGTRLAVTYSYQFDEGTVFQDLEKQLNGFGVFGKPLSLAELDEITSEANKPFSDFVGLIAQFLALYKGSGLAETDLQASARSERERVFVSVFGSIFKAYQEELASSRTIDFDDMIVKARHAISSKSSTSPFRYVVVDEFQDISNIRLGLIQDLLNQRRHSRLFAVGDDWQSIYRFTGSDIGIITQFDRRFKGVQRVDLDTAFRYSQGLLDASSTFVEENPAQLRKQLVAHSGPSPILPICVILTEQSREGASADPFQLAFREIAGMTNGTKCTVKMIGRYRFNEPKEFGGYRAKLEHQGIQLEYQTAHQSKGTEADFVIIAGLEAGIYGFPSNVSDDPLMRLVLSDSEAFPYAEERRLFYVALTRARKRVYLIVPADTASPFVEDELLSEKYSAFVEVLGEISERHLCPVCSGKTIKRRTGKFGNFWGCSHYPLCPGKLKACPECRTGGLVRLNAGLRSEYRCTDCRKVVAGCPQCSDGYLIRRTGRYGAFWGCSNWSGGDGCGFTQKLRN
jgi:DNA helicase IV